MYIFRSINEIVNTIATAKALLTELFEKRNLTCFRYSDALSLLKDDENTHFRRSDFIGVIKDECVPDWAKEKLEALNSSETEDISMGGMQQ